MVKRTTQPIALAAVLALTCGTAFAGEDKGKHDKTNFATLDKDCDGSPRMADYPPRTSILTCRDKLVAPGALGGACRVPTSRHATEIRRWRRVSRNELTAYKPL